MPKFGTFSSKEVVKILKKADFVEDRQRGSHLILIHQAKNLRVTVPIGKKDLPIGTVRSIFRAAKIESFTE